MTVKEMSDFFGKSEATIRRVARNDVGIDFKNGVPYLFNKNETEKISEKLYKKVPIAVKESINYTFSKVKGVPLQNEQVDYVRKSDLKEFAKEIVSEILKSVIPLIQNNNIKQIEKPKDKAAYIGEKIAEQIRAKNERKQQANKTQLFLFEVGE